MSRRLTTSLVAAGIMATLSIFAACPSLAQAIDRNTHRPKHTTHDRRTPCERDPRCLESLSRAAAYGNLNSPHHPTAHRIQR